MNNPEAWIPEKQKPHLQPAVQAQVDLFILGELQKKNFSTFFYSLWTITESKGKGKGGKASKGNEKCYLLKVSLYFKILSELYMLFKMIRSILNTPFMTLKEKYNFTGG